MLLTELIKLAVCLAILGVQAARKLSRSTLRQLSLRHAVHVATTFIGDSLPLAFPALLFTAQSQLNLFAATGLDAVSFAVTNQLKLLPTAFFSALYLGRRLTRAQWASLPGLALGVAIVNSSTGQLDSHGAATFGSEWWWGLGAAVLAAVFSGYAGVYCERLLKIGLGTLSLRASKRLSVGSEGGEQRPARVPLLTLNLQLSMWGALLAGAQVLGASSAAEAGTGARAPLLGFGGYAWSVVGLQALGGLVVSVVIKYTDNIVKGFAMALSILLSWGLSIPLFGLQPSPIFMLGLLLVVGSVMLFSAGETGDAALGLTGGDRPEGKRRRPWAEGRDAGWLNVSALCAGVATGILCALVWLGAGGA